jgi:hypothetical protein
MVSGCAGKKPPPVVPVEGIVYLDNRPLPFARIDFIPMVEDFGAELNSYGVTDENGRYTLTCFHGNQPGAVAAEHRVLISEHTPDDVRGGDANSQKRMTEYVAKLKNRPIPREYSELSQQKVTIEVKAGQTTYDIRLTRSGQ